MKIIFCLTFAVLAIEAIEGRTYGPPKKAPVIKKDAVKAQDNGLIGGGGIGGDRWSRGGINSDLDLLGGGLGLDGIRGRGGFGQSGLDRQVGGGFLDSRSDQFGGLGRRFNGEQVFGDFGRNDGVFGGVDRNNGLVGGFGRRDGLLGDLDRNTGFGGRFDRNEGGFGSRFRANSRQGGMW